MSAFTMMCPDIVAADSRHERTTMAVAWWVWAATVAGFALAIAIDLRVARRSLVVTYRRAVIWSATYIGLALLFGAGVWIVSGSELAVQFLTGFAVEKTLSVDNVFVFAIVLASFAIATEHQARVLTIGVIGALGMRVVLIVVGISAVDRFSVLFLVFGLFLLYVGARLIITHGAPPDVRNGRVLRAVRRFVPIVDESDEAEPGALVVRHQGRRALTSAALAVIAILSVDVVFALDSVPAILGITRNTYLVVCTNVFALLGLRPLYFLLIGLRDRLVHLHYGIAIVLGFIGVKLSLHYLHTVWHQVPEISTLASLAVIALVFAATTLTSLRATRD
jgi:tellurite resistance protein TerC